MKKTTLILSFLTLLISSTSYAQFPSPYCQINSNYWGVEEITSVVFGDDTIITNTNDTDILVNFTSTVADVEHGETYTITVEGYTGGDYENEYVAFIDWNQNGVLDDAGEVYYIGLIYDSTGYDGQSASTTISVPTTALTGETRIRITKTYTDEFYEVSLNIDPCYISTYEVGWGLDGSYGQALDFTINVLANDPCADVLAPTGAATQEVALNATLADLDVTGTNLTWYSDVALTTEVAETFVFDQVGEFMYYVTQTVGDCTSDALAITITVIEYVDPCADLEAPTAESPQTITVEQTLADIIVDGENLTWYSDSDLTEVVEDTFVFEEGIYTFWVTQTVGDCVSEATEIQVEVTLSTNGFDNASFRTYPNPVKDFFNVSYSKEITSISVVNILGQTVIEKAVNATDTQFDMTSLPTGSYFVKVTTEGAVKTVKVVKQ